MKKLISVITVAALAGSLAMAQGPGPGQGGGQGGRGGFGQGRMMGGGARFVLRADVAKELNLTDAQKKTLEEKLPQMGRGGRGGPGGGNQGGGGERPNPDQMRAQQEQAEKTIKETLSETQYKRYKELQLQQQGAGALMNPEVQKELGITDAQKAQIQKVQQTAMDNMRDKMEELRESGDREAMMAEMQKMREATNKQILDVLTAEQKAKFETMKGKPFKFENPGRGGGGF